MTNAISKNSARQELHFAYVDFDYTNVNSTNFTPAIELPAGAVIHGGAVIVKSATNASNITVGDSASGARYLGATSTASAGRTPLVPTGFTTTGVSNVGVTFSAALTQGSLRLEASYYIEGRATSTQG